jgi:hypothetical protein
VKEKVGNTESSGTLDSSVTCDQHAKKRPKVGFGLETLRTENCERQDKLAADFLLSSTRRRHG